MCCRDDREMGKLFHEIMSREINSLNGTEKRAKSASEKSLCTGSQERRRGRPRFGIGLYQREVYVTSSDFAICEVLCGLAG